MGLKRCVKTSLENAVLENEEVSFQMMAMMRQNKILLPCDCLLWWNDTETSLILCERHYYDYDSTDVADKSEEFIMKVLDPSGSHFSSEVLNELR